MTIQEIQQLIFDISGHKTGCRKNTGSMKPYLTFQIQPLRDKYTEEFTDQQRTDIARALKMSGTFTDWYRIDIQTKHITQEAAPQPKQTALF